MLPAQLTTGVMLGVLLVNIAVDHSGDAAANSAYYRVLSMSFLTQMVVPATLLLMAAAAGHTVHHSGSLASKINAGQLLLLALPFFMLVLQPQMALAGAQATNPAFAVESKFVRMQHHILKY